MRDLIGSRVTLANVKRALDNETDPLAHDRRLRLLRAIDCMTEFLNAVIVEFQRDYKPIADKQRLYEGNVNAFLAANAGPSENVLNWPTNPAWKDICGLSLYTTLLRSPRSDFESPPAYTRRFTNPLDFACLLLREELSATTGRRPKGQARSAAAVMVPSEQWGYHVWATFEVSKGCESTFITAASANGQQSVLREPGALVLDCIADPPTDRFHLDEVYSNKEAFEVHKNGPNSDQFFARIENCAEQPRPATEGTCLLTWAPRG